MSAPPVAVWRAIAVGMAALASAMGIGRFAFTPMLPLMQQAGALSLQDGAWLAGANYFGYLLGAMACMAAGPRPDRAARGGLVAVAATTLAMAFADGFVAWMLLRLAAGVASAFVLVGATGWALGHLAARQHAEGAGWVFAGVGAGIVAAGLVGLGAGVGQTGPEPAWAVLGAVASGLAAATWRAWRVLPEPGAPAAGGAAPGPAEPRLRMGAEAWTLVIAYGVFGLGYIIPATFLPAVARSLIADPALFGWAWPVFGLAAAASTVLVARLRLPPRELASRSLWVMAAGVLAPALHPSLPTVMVSALCVGGTFVVVTMAGLQEGRRLAGAAPPARLIAGMTAAFALGQLAGPLMVRSAGSITQAIALPSIVSAVLLAAAALALRWPRRRGAAAEAAGG